MKEFQPWPKIFRVNREVIITEKIDGTNAAIVITDDDIYAQSRSRVITPQDDNFGFAAWVESNKHELRETLGHGRHFGEWWGRGIQRTYGLSERRFSLFNVSRWEANADDNFRCVQSPLCYVVPTLGIVQSLASPAINEYVENLREGSYAALGFDKPEGIVVFQPASNYMFKVTCEKDESPKSLIEQKKCVS